MAASGPSLLVTYGNGKMSGEFSPINSGSAPQEALRWPFTLIVVPEGHVKAKLNFSTAFNPLAVEFI